MKNLKHEILIIILFITIGLATVTSNLILNGITPLASNTDDFNVYFSDVKVDGVQDLSLVDTKTTLIFHRDFENLNEKVEIAYDITNGSRNYDANIEINCTENTEYLVITNTFDAKTSLSAQSTRSGVLTVTVYKSNPNGNITQNISCNIEASAVERTTIENSIVPGALKDNYAILKATYEEDMSDFRSMEYRATLKNINIEQGIDIPEEAVDVWDISESENQTVMAYTLKNNESSCLKIENGELVDFTTECYDLYIQSDTQLYGNRNMSYWFSTFFALESIKGLEHLDTSMTTDMSYMFSTLGMFSNKIEFDISSLETSNVTNMSYMFSRTGSQIGSYEDTFTIDFSNFDTSSVTNMKGMFYETSPKNKVILDLSRFDTSKVTDMSYMFGNLGYESASVELNISNFNTNNVTNMSRMFINTACYSGKLYVDISKLNTSKVTDMSYMFSGIGTEGSSYFIPDVSHFDTKNVTNMSGMFSDLALYNEDLNLDLSNFDTSKVTDMSYMFSGLGSFVKEFTLDLSNFDTSKVTNMSGMFKYLSERSNEVNLIIDGWNTSNVADMSEMFYEATNLKVDLSVLDTSKLINATKMFYGMQNTSSNLQTSLTIKNPYTIDYEEMFYNSFIGTSSNLTINYTQETENLIDKMITTKSSNSNIIKGNLIQ